MGPLKRVFSMCSTQWVGKYGKSACTPGTSLWRSQSIMAGRTSVHTPFSGKLQESSLPARPDDSSMAEGGPEAGVRERGAANSKGLDRIRGFALGNELRQDLPDQTGEFARVPGADGDGDLGVVGEPVDD